MKKILALVLVLSMVLGSFGFAFAATTAETNAGEVLKGLGVLTGDLQGNLNLDTQLKRQDMIVLLSRLFAAEDEAKAFPLPTQYEDVVDEFYKSYIGWAQAEQLTDGIGNNKFGFDQELTVKELVTFILRAMGYADAWNQAEVLGVELGLVAAGANFEATVSRGFMAETTLAALNAPIASDDKVSLGDKLGLDGFSLVPDTLEVVSVSAIKANELKVAFNMAVDTANATVKVTRGNSAVTGKAVWNADKTEAVFTTEANMINGTYTVEVTVKVEGQDNVVVSGKTDVVARAVDKIVILNDVALTGDSNAPTDTRDLAYVYFDVLDQYGESIRNTTNLTWTSSVGGDVTSNADRRTGEIKLQRTGQQFMFGEKIFISGVDTKTGKSVQHELTVGQPRALDQIQIAGFVKKGTTTILKELPAGFKSSTYYMVFTAVDQNGNEYTTDIKEADLTFVSDNPLLVLKLDHDGVAGNVKTLVVDGVQYGAIFVQPGMNVDRGGEANIMSISTKTGKQNVLNVKIGDSIILSQFDLLHPSGVTAEGEKIEIPFQAIDQHGNAITNFTVLARQASLNALSFNTGGQGSLVLSEKNDGTAKLEYVQAAVNWNNAIATDGINRPVSLTSIVTGGNASTLMLSISDKARPEAISAVKMDKVIVEQGELKLNLSNSKDDNSFTFVDQYGRTMTRANAIAFFAAGNTFAAGNDFIGYTFAIKATYKGDNNVFAGLTNDVPFEITNGSTHTFQALANTTTTAKSGMAMQFEIVKHKGVFGSALSISPIKTEAVTVVDITAVRNLVVKEVPKLFLQTSQSNAATGEGLTLADAVTGTIVKQKSVTVTGSYNAETVTVPTAYYTLDSDGLTFAAGKVNGIKALVAAVSYSPAVPAVAQVETATVVEDTIAAGSIDVTVTAAGSLALTGGKTINVILDGNESDAEAIAVKVRNGLTADSDVDAFFTVSGTNANVVLTAKVADANDSTMNIELANNGGGTIIVDAATSANTTAGAVAVPEVLAVPQQGFAWRNLYDETTARTLRKDATTNVKATITNLDVAGTPVIDTASRTVTISDAAPVATTIAGPVELTVRPTNTAITVAAIEAAVLDATDKNYEVKDQYNEIFAATKLYRALEVVENAEGYASNNFKVSQNDTAGLTIEGAERGDTFTLVVRAEGAQLTVKVTVGADTNAKIDATGNVYLNTLVPVLEIQRNISLQ